MFSLRTTTAILAAALTAAGTVAAAAPATADDTDIDVPSFSRHFDAQSSTLPGFAGTDVTAHFEMPEFGPTKGTFGCNIFEGSINMNNEYFGINIASMTRKSCDDVSNAAEDALVRFFENGPLPYTKDANGTMTVTAPTGHTVVLSTTPTGNDSGTSDDIIIGIPEYTRHLVPAKSSHKDLYNANVTAHFSISETGVLHGFSGCNEFSGTATWKNDKKGFVGNITMSTFMLCDDATMAAEAAFRSNITGKVTLLTTANGDTLVNPFSGNAMTVTATKS